MRRLFRWLGYGLVGLMILALGAVAFVYARSEQIVRRTYDVPHAPVTLPSGPLDTDEGRRLASLRGCYAGCHGDELEGGVFFDEPLVGRLVAPDLTQVASRYTDAELELAIRHGIRPDGRSTLAMPSSMFHLLSDQDLAAIISFIRAAPVTPGPDTEIRLGPLARLGIVLGRYEPQAALIDHVAPHRAVSDTADSVGFGRYLALTNCGECHGPDLRGDPELPAPDLRVAGGYPDDAFVRLMREGVALGDREVGLMSEVARGRFIHFTDVEIRALHAYLRALGEASDQEAGS